MKQACEKWKRDSNLKGLCGDVGELVEEIFSGPTGDRIMQVTSIFCAHQQHALDNLRQR